MRRLKLNVHHVAVLKLSQSCTSPHLLLKEAVGTKTDIREKNNEADTRQNSDVDEAG